MAVILNAQDLMAQLLGAKVEDAKPNVTVDAAKMTPPSEPEDTTPAGMKSDVKNLYQKRDKHDNFVWVDEYPDDLTDPAENAETAKYALLVRNKKSYEGRKLLEIDSIIVQSPLLKEVLGTVLKDYPGITTNLDHLTFRPPFKPFVHRWHKLVEAMSSEKNEETKRHLDLLYQVLHTELKDTIAAKNDLVSNKVMNFEHMWTIFQPGALIYAIEDGEQRLFEMTTADYGRDCRGEPVYAIRCTSVDWDGEKFGIRHEYVQNNSFEGTKAIIRLQAFPLEYHANQAKVKTDLIERGKLFERFHGFHYKAYKGVALGYGFCGLVKYNVSE